MKIKPIFVIALLMAGLCSTTGWSQTQSKMDKKDQKQRMKKQANSGVNQRTTTDTSVQDARYMRTSVSNGTATNNSNNTNYNSNNAINNPTGAGSNPNTTVTTDKPTAKEKKSPRKPDNKP